MYIRYGKSVLFWNLKGKVQNNLAFIATLSTAKATDTILIWFIILITVCFCTIENIEAKYLNI